MFSPLTVRIARVRRAAIPEPGPLRTLALSTLINTFGNGLFRTIEVIYFTLYVGLSPAKVALALSIGGGISLLFSVPSGHLADRFGPRDIGVIAYLLEGILLALFIFVHSYGSFLVLVIATEIVGTVGQNMRMATVARMGVGEERVRIRAYTRAVTNFGIGVGTVFAGVALAINTGVAYKSMLLADTVTYFAAAYVFRRLPFTAPTVEKGAGFSFEALRNIRYLAATLLNGIMSLHFVLQGVAIPLWVVNETNAPRWWVAVIMVVNTTAVMLFQVRVSKGINTVKDGGRAFRRASFYVAISCLLYAISSQVNVYAACALLVLAMLVHVAGELVGSVGTWAIGFGLADQGRQGQYQGVWSLGWGIGGTLGPSIVTALCIGMGRSGWVILAGIFLLTGLAMNALVRTRSESA